MNGRLMLVVGARPQFVKLAPILWALEEDAQLRPIVVHTGQHHDPDMSQIFFEELRIAQPSYHLGVHGGNHGDMTGRMLQGLEPIVVEERPDRIMVFGDTNSTLAAALVGSKLHIPVAHVEAGLRSYNRQMPEEINRVVADHLSDLLFCPTQHSVGNLAQEGILTGVHLVGDVMLDCVLRLKQIRKPSNIIHRFRLAPGDYSILTLHRAENVDDDLKYEQLLRFVRDSLNTDELVWPVHPRNKVRMNMAREILPKAILCEPLGYFEMFDLLANCREVFTDSGGLQKEAYFHGKDCTTLRSETEWPETVESGWNRLWTESRRESRRSIEDYGAGRAAKDIIEIIENYP